MAGDETGDRAEVWIVGVCNECGPDWWMGVADIKPLFRSCAEAAFRLPRDYGWHVGPSGDGRLLMLCRLCARFETCVRRGRHDYAPFADGGFDYGLVCVTCSVPSQWPGVPDGHPDSMTAPLPREQEWFLAALDEELFPEEAA